MTVFTYSQARQNLATLLSIATKEGEVLVKRRDGQTYAIRPEKKNESPLDVKGVKLNLGPKDIMKIMREIRRR
ncbi:MAG: prevent-host-death protein [Candidatus Raymondbacteria bacterium RifOxyA12_full_50_37]|uniref:Prevent-host-death protein n=1 Tax=Candidatus Raymondbacteria bacterium RIFOXYD12_FULL_49_13 TaxID=1817890 RepID=A0A1F7FGI4_UNCRA|nr:MAG: prevent-host-death protein [Candidatus Raymondbacteria bacterium RifOxyA12_full_50_37]OGJ91687.1 MAG: prevent-host-death protein [Candidatus Raymondbacteria bacterium RIFOXYA2_FULL_49_16]OGJ98698.1 MAG: prevent-host-death protein [Candidatus Raymondbacteria bacterium RIFOXYC2_FULL_50_21]OGK02188.1 MAG: prevent-host-death protein [Candidatus Raymondbacteria bacterium RifOxyB12_full_50_8]OGK05805.1 MAG: prevent-host-death protein [Candidatus Raymondbacteria bacterium RIFOXYD12_FULL_49_13]